MMSSCRWRMGAHPQICWRRAIRPPNLIDFQLRMVLDLQTIYLNYKDGYISNFLCKILKCTCINILASWTILLIIITCLNCASDIGIYSNSKIKLILYFTYQVCNQSFMNKLEILPLKTLLSRYKSSSSFMFPISEGNDPLSLLLDR